MIIGKLVRKNVTNATAFCLILVTHFAKDNNHLKQTK